MERPTALLPVEAAPGRLAVDRDNLTAPGVCGEGRDEATEAGLEPVRVEQAEHPREGVVAGNPALQAHDAAQQRLLGAPEQGHVDRGLGARQGPRQRDQIVLDG